MAANQRGVVANWIRRADFLLQPYFCLTRELFFEEPDTAIGTGVYTAEDWAKRRQMRTEPFEYSEDRYGSDESYRRYLDAIHESKILAVLSLIRRFNIGRYGRVLELGCGDMPQAYTICSQFRNISYAATDYDPYVIERCSRLPLLSGIRKFVLDVTRSDLEELKDHDLVISWSLEFALENRQLKKLFAACKKYSIPYLLCTHTAIGPLGYLSRALSLKERRKHMQRPRLRMLGWQRSIGEIARLARQVEVNLQWKSYHVNHAALFFI